MMPLCSIAKFFQSLRTGLFVSAFALLLTVTGPVHGQVDLEQLNPFGEDPDGEAAGVEGVEGVEGAEAPEQRTVEEVFEEATNLVNEQKYDEAIPLLSQILTASPNYVPAALVRGQAFFEIGEMQLALESYGLAVNYGVRFPALYGQALAARGSVLMDLGNFEEAADDFSLAVQSAPSNPEYLFLRGKAYARLAQTPSSGFGDSSTDYAGQAISSLSRAIAIQDDYAEAYAERGNIYSLSNPPRFEDAIEDFQKAVSLDGETPNYQAQQGFLFLRRAEFERRRPKSKKNQVVQDFQNAINAFSTYLASEGQKPKSEFEGLPDNIFRPGQVYLGRASANVGLANEQGGAGQRGLYESAITDSDQAYDFDDNSVSALFQKGVAQRLKGDLEAAADTFTEVLDLVPTFSEANIRRGIVHYYLGDLEAARRDFEQGISNSQTRDGRPEFWLGVTFAKEGDYESAIRHYSRCIKLNPRFKPAYSNRGLAFMQTEQYRRATGDFDELLRRNRKDTISRQRRDQAKQLMLSQSRNRNRR